MPEITPQRHAQPGELCTCGRSAMVVYLSELHGQVGFCGVHNVPQLMPCAFCGQHIEHIGGRCPDYRVRPVNVGDGQC